jgi:hypothetical protein
MTTEAIFWTSTTPGYNTRDREREHVVAGKRIKERFPQHGHEGSYDSRKRARGQRFIRVVRHDGHVVPLVLTNAAAHLDPTTPFGNYQRAKMRHLGWFPLGSCPLAMLATSQVTPEQFVNQAMLKDAPCAPGSYTEAKPCPHCAAETVARQKAHAEFEVGEMAKFKDPTEKLVEAGREQTQAIVGAITDALKKPAPKAAG